MRIAPNTTLNELQHNESSSDELQHWGAGKGVQKKDHKYIKREWKGSRWQYWYKDDALAGKNKSALNKTAERVKTNINTAVDKAKSDVKESVKSSVDKTADKAIAKANEASKGMNDIVDKAKQVINKFYDDPNNKYDVNSGNYNKKMAQIKETKEWKDIVARSDPEYVKKNEDGTVSYNIDKYLVDKKHPLLDVIGDVAAGRNVDINEITKESSVAGLKDWAFGYLHTGALAVGVLSTVLTEKFKLSQGSYDDDIKRLTKIINEGTDYTKAILDDAKTVVSEGKATADRVKTVADSSADIAKDKAAVDPASVERMAKAIREGQIAAEAARSVNEGNVVAAAKIIMQSETLRGALGDNEYYSLLTNTLDNLSVEEQAAVNLLVKQLRK